MSNDTLVSFSGVSLAGYLEVFDVLTGAAGSQDTPYTDEYSEYIPHDSRSWTFETSSHNWAASGSAESWTYQQATVPLPPSVFLLGSGLVGLLVLRRFRRS